MAWQYKPKPVLAATCCKRLPTWLIIAYLGVFLVFNLRNTPDVAMNVHQQGHLAFCSSYLVFDSSSLFLSEGI